MNPGIYKNLPMADYLALPALSAGIIRHIVERCPKAAWWESWLNPNRERDDTAASDAGTIAHSILLEGGAGRVAVIDPTDHPAEKTGNIPDGWTNKSIRTARDDARALGLIPVLKSDMERIEQMVDGAHTFIQSLQATEPDVWALFQPDGGESELTCVWNDNGTLCKMRADRISLARHIIVDLKFTGLSAEPEAQGRGPLVANRISAAFYRRGIQALFQKSPAYLFLVTEFDAPHLSSLVGVDQEGFAIAAEKVEFGIREWRRCLAADYWPGYPNRAVYPEVRAWERMDWESRQGLTGVGIPYDYETMTGKAGPQ